MGQSRLSHCFQGLGTACRCFFGQGRCEAGEDVHEDDRSDGKDSCFHLEMDWRGKATVDQKMKALIFLLFFPCMAWGASCQPWTVRIVYPQSSRQIQYKPRAKYVQKVAPKPEPKPEDVWTPPQGTSSFVSGSAEKSEFDDYKRWKEEYEQSEPVKAKKRKEQAEEAKRLLIDVLNEIPYDRPARKERQDEEE